MVLTRFLMFLITCTCVCVCVSVCAHECRHPQRPENGVGSPKDGVLGGCESPNIASGSRAWSSTRAVCTANHLSNFTRILILANSPAKPWNPSSIPECPVKASIELTGVGFQETNCLPNHWVRAYSMLLNGNLIFLPLPGQRQPGPAWILLVKSHAPFLLAQGSVLQLLLCWSAQPCILCLCAEDSHLLLPPNLFTTFS